MVELHSWITIRETYEICDDADDARVIQNIKQVIQGLNIEVSVKVRNGEYYIEFSLYTNHFSEDVKEYLNFFSEIGKIAKGSYGLLYLRNDEDAIYCNEFQIWRLSRGEVRRFDDKILSPFVPTVEDFDTELKQD
ncbi:MAG: immunity 7 family protein [Lachnospiraceae bacterium]|nr:immunity 7 family protein [Lachnospiraceae bacterium]